MQTTTCKRAACGLAVPPYQRAKPIYLPSNATDASRGRPPAFFRNPRKALHLESKSTAYTPKSAGSALVIGKIVLTMLVAAAKINQSSIVPAFDQTRVPRIIQAISAFPGETSKSAPRGNVDVSRARSISLLCVAARRSSRCFMHGDQ